MSIGVLSDVNGEGVVEKFLPFVLAPLPFSIGLRGARKIGEI